MTIALEFGWFGFGGAWRPVANVRLGVLRVWCMGGSMSDALKKLRADLAIAVAELRRKD